MVGGNGGTARWLALNAGLALALAALAYLLVGAVDDDIEVGDYLYALFFAALMWPFYMLLVARISKRRRFRLIATLTAPLLGLPLTVGLLFVNVPEILAAWIFYILYGLTVRPR